MCTPTWRSWHFHSVQNSSSTRPETIQVCTAPFSYFTSHSFAGDHRHCDICHQSRTAKHSFYPIRYFQHVQGCVNKSANLWCQLKWTLTYVENPKSLIELHLWMDQNRLKDKKKIIFCLLLLRSGWHRISDPQVALLGHLLSQGTQGRAQPWIMRVCVCSPSSVFWETFTEKENIR